MRKKMLSTFVFMTALVAKAQVLTPKASPSAEVTQIVGLTEVEIEYARPATKGRSVFGDLVPYGRLWRTGANENTTIQISEDIMIDGKVLSKGKYAVYTIPAPNQWEIIFYKTTNNWGLPKEFAEDNVALKTVQNAENISKKTEYFTISINPISDSQGEIIISWENTKVTLPFDVFTHQKTMESIKNLNTESKPSDYFAAAQYLYSSDTDHKKALEYINKALESQEEAPFYMYRVKSLIQAKLGDKQGAIETAKISLKKSQEAKNDDYIKMNRDSILEWSK